MKCSPVRASSTSAKDTWKASVALLQFVMKYHKVASSLPPFGKGLKCFFPPALLSFGKGLNYFLSSFFFLKLACVPVIVFWRLCIRHNEGTETEAQSPQR